MERTDSLKHARTLVARTRARARSLLVAERVALLVAVYLVAAVAGGMIDYWLRLPAPVRWLAWLIALASVLWYARARILPALRFAPSLVDVALRIERSGPGRAAGLEGSLASSLELAGPGERDGDANDPRSLRGRAAREATSRVSGAHGLRVLDSHRARVALGWLVLSAIPLVALLAASPAMTARGALRVLTPWVQVEWPRRTMVVATGEQDVLPITRAVPLRAVLVRTNRGPGETRVAARIEGTIDGVRIEPRRVLLTAQGQRESVMLDGRTAVRAGVADRTPLAGEVYERLLELGEIMPPAESGVATPSTAELSVTFETQDDTSEPVRVRLSAPPEIVAARATIDPPAYASGVPLLSFASGERDLGTGADARGAVDLVLAGSRVHVSVEFSEDVSLAAASREAIRTALSDAGDPDATLEVMPRAWELSWIARSDARIPLRAIDLQGLTMRDDAVFSFGVSPDAPPSPAVIEPARDESVLPSAAVDLAVRASDDVLLASLALETQRAVAPKDSAGAPAEPEGQPTALSHATEPGAVLEARARLDLSTLTLSPGDELWITALASDTFSFEGATHEPVRTAPRKLRIISASDFVEQVRAELTGVRQSAIRADEEQAALAERIARGEARPDDARTQRSITDQIAAQRRFVRDLEERVARNRLSDDGIEGLLRDAGEALDEAARASDQAREEIERAAEQERAAGAAGDQQRVRDELASVVSMLDRGEDGWVARRAIEELLREQRSLTADTERASRETLGRALDELTPQQRRTLEDLAERQRQQGEEAQRAIDDLQSRSEQLRETDPELSRGLRQAAQRAREQGVPRQMEGAAQQIDQNQTQQAQQSQQDAIESLEQMLEDLEDSQRGRDAALRRLLADVKQTIADLVMTQEREIGELGRAQEGTRGAAGLDAGMIALHTRTLSAVDRIGEAGRELLPVLREVRAAGDQQIAAITSLRSSDLPAADGAEQESLRHLQQALAETERLDDRAADRESRRQRSELRKAYREMLELEVALRDATATYAGAEVTRRQRAEVRAIGERQETLRMSLRELESQSSVLADAPTFGLAHAQLDARAIDAVSDLRAGDPSERAVRRQGSMVRILQSLVKSLDETPPEEQFRDGQQGGGAQGGEQQGQPPPVIPPLAELRLLRGLQGEALALTRDAADLGAEPSEIDALAQLQEDVAARAQAILETMNSSSPAGEQQGDGADPTPQMRGS
ncbi:MAG: hypothetical protein RBS39_13540 [Phycisphaerales bacterium]|jgi:hypothetical protein|nr:hypothetical protein [Phycisphaerales bacterium]